MKNFFLCVALLCAINIFAQNLNKDTIQLKEIVVRSQKSKPKIKKFSYRSNHTLLENLEYSVDEAITLVDKLPAGWLHSVTFKFNTASTDKYVAYDYKDTQLELLFYEVNPDNTPGNPIVHEKKIITVSGDFSGKMEIGLANLNIKSDGKIFIGLKRLNKSGSDTREFEVDCLYAYEPNYKYISFSRQDSTLPWKLSTMIAAFRMDVKVEAD